MIFWNTPLVVAAAISAGIFLNPAGNAGIGAYRMALTPADLQGRVQSAIQFVGDVRDAPGPDARRRADSAWLGGPGQRSQCSASSRRSRPSSPP